MLDVEVDNFTLTELRTRSLAHPPLLFTRVDVTSFIHELMFSAGLNLRDDLILIARTSCSSTNIEPM
jgi:hypothetical protein